MIRATVVLREEKPARAHHQEMGAKAEVGKTSRVAVVAVVEAVAVVAKIPIRTVHPVDVAPVRAAAVVLEILVLEILGAETPGAETPGADVAEIVAAIEVAIEVDVSVEVAKASRSARKLPEPSKGSWSSIQRVTDSCVIPARIMRLKTATRSCPAR